MAISRRYKKDFFKKMRIIVKILIAYLKVAYMLFIYLGAFFFFFILAEYVYSRWNNRNLSKTDIINGYYLEEHNGSKMITANVHNDLLPIRNVENFCVEGKYIHGSKKPEVFGEGYFIINTEINDVFITAQYTEDGSDFREYQHYATEYGLQECNTN